MRSGFGRAWRARRWRGRASARTRSRFARGSDASSVSSTMSVMPMITFIGVRTSWLMLARNIDLARVEASAWSRARAPLVDVARALLLRALALADVPPVDHDAADGGIIEEVG